MGADEVHLGSSRLVERGCRGARQACSLAVGRGQVHGIRGCPEAGEERARWTAAACERQNGGALAQRHSVAPEPEGARGRRGRGRPQRLEAGSDEDRDVVEAPREDDVARTAREATHSEADGEHGRSARAEDEHRRVEDHRERPGASCHRAEVGRCLAVADGLAARESNEGALRGPHPAARRPQDQTNPLALPPRPADVEVRRACRESSREEPRRPVVRVVHVRPRRERSPQPRAGELLVLRDRDASRLPDGAGAGGFRPFPERRDRPEREDRDVAHRWLSVSGSSNASAIGGSEATDSRSSSIARPVFSSR